MTARLVFAAALGRFEQAFAAMYEPIARAAQAAVTEAGGIAQKNARADIARAGFGPRWQNALRLNVYPKNGVSAGAAAYLYHKIPYASVFETGATIRGKPKLWVPLPWAPKRAGNLRMTPKNYMAATGQTLYPIRRGNRTYLATTVRLSRSAAAAKSRAVSTSALRRGRTGRGGGLVPTAVPLFVALDTVTLKKRFNFEKICAAAQGRLTALYFKHFKAGNGG